MKQAKLSRTEKLTKRLNTLKHLVGIGCKKYILELLDVENELELMKPTEPKHTEITIGSRVLKKNYGTSHVIPGTVIEIHNGIAVVQWEKKHNFKKDIPVKSLQIYSEEAYKKIIDKKNYKAFMEFKRLVESCSDGWESAFADDGVTKRHEYWTYTRGYIELKHQSDKGVTHFRITDKGREFAASL